MIHLVIPSTVSPIRYGFSCFRYRFLHRSFTLYTIRIDRSIINIILFGINIFRLSKGISNVLFSFFLCSKGRIQGKHSSLHTARGSLLLYLLATAATVGWGAKIITTNVQLLQPRDEPCHRTAVYPVHVTPAASPVDNKIYIFALIIRYILSIFPSLLGGGVVFLSDTSSENFFLPFFLFFFSFTILPNFYNILTFLSSQC